MGVSYFLRHYRTVLTRNFWEIPALSLTLSRAKDSTTTTDWKYSSISDSTKTTDWKYGSISEIRQIGNTAVFQRIYFLTKLQHHEHYHVKQLGKPPER